MVEHVKKRTRRVLRQKFGGEVKKGKALSEG